VASGLVPAALEQWGRLDMVESMDLATWQAALACNLTSAFLVTQAAVPAMTSRGWGRIIMVASLRGEVMAIRADVGYATAKAGVVGLTGAAAVDTARHGITVNAVAPGWIATGSQTPDERGQGQATPAGRSGSPGEIAAAIAWPASPGASCITGNAWWWTAATRSPSSAPRQRDRLAAELARLTGICPVTSDPTLSPKDGQTAPVPATAILERRGRPAGCRQSARSGGSSRIWPGAPIGGAAGPRASAAARARAA